MGPFRRGLSRAWTDPDSPDPRLTGREYAVPFVRVWTAALETAAQGQRWTVLASDPRRGEIHAEARPRLQRFAGDVWVRVSLDEDGQTRVDVASQSRREGADFGANARRIARFLHALDRRLGDGAPG